MLQGGPMPHDFIPLMGMATGIVTMVLIAVTIVKVAQSHIGQAIGRRIHGRGADDPELRAELEELREQVVGLHQRVTESEERLDFAERLLAGKHEPARLPEPPALDPRR